MQKKYKVTVNKNLPFDLQSLDITKLDILKLPNKNFHLIKDHKSFEATIIKNDFNNKTYQLVVNGTNYTVIIENELDILIKKMGFTAGNSKISNDIKAPMPGLILSVNVKNNQEVKEGDVLLILEAMKMENAITAPKSGIVKMVSAKKGVKVDKGTLLIQMH